MHRIWALIDRSSYASFWTGLMYSRGTAYYLIMGILSALCILGIVTFFMERGKNHWWRWIYLFGGAYVLFDLAAIATGLKAWQRFLEAMFDTVSPYWNHIWIFFVLLGTASFLLGMKLMVRRRKIAAPAFLTENQTD